MRVVPSDDFLSLVVVIDLVVNIYEAILGKRQVDTSLPRIPCRQSMLNDNKLLVVFVQAPLAHEDASHLIL
jgi:hypothetical protein